MKNFNRIFSLLLALVLVLTCTPRLPLRAEAAEIWGSGSITENGYNIYWEVDVDGNLTISGTGAIPDYDYYEPTYAPWGEYSISKVVIGSGITAIGDQAFDGEYELTSVSIPSTVTAIGYEAFARCPNLATVSVPSSVTLIETRAFDETAWWDAQPDGVVYLGNVLYGYKGEMPASVTIKSGTRGIAGLALCGSAMTSVTIPGTVVSIAAGAFSSCENLTTVTIPASVTYLDPSAFEYCYSLTQIKVSSSNNNYCDVSGVVFNKNKTTLVCAPDGKTGAYTVPSTVTAIGKEAFYNCYGLTGIVIPNSVTSIGEYAFAWCQSMETLTIGSSVKTIDDMAFADCVSLTGVTIPNSVTYIGASAFSGCSMLSSLKLGSSVATIEEWAFIACDSLTGVTIPASVTSIKGGAFARCNALTSITVDPANKKYCDVGGVLFSKDKTVLVTYPTGKSGAYTIPATVTTIGDSAFVHTTKLTGVEIPNSVTKIGEESFYGSDALTDLKIPDSVTEIGVRAFEDCSGLVTLELGASVASIGNYAFSGCRKLTAIKLPDSVTTIGEYLFRNCRALKKVEFGKSISQVPYGTFSECYAVEELWFYGSAPDFDWSVLRGITATAYYYPDSTWTEYKLGNHGGSITWVALECEHTYTTAVTQPTCAAEGYTTHTCTKCGDSYKDTYTPKLNHVRSTADPAPVPHCEVERFDSFTCMNCREDIVQLIKPIGHSYSITEVVEPGCETQGYTVHTCLRCGKTYMDSYVNGKGHTYDNGVITQPSTCTVAGVMVFTCITCGATKSETLTMPAHQYGEWEHFDECLHVRRCVECGGAPEFALHDLEKLEHIAMVGYVPDKEYYCTVCLYECREEMNIYASGTCGAEGGNVMWILDQEGTLRISGIGAMADYSSERTAPWYDDRTRIKRVIVGELITGIGSYAFAECTNAGEVYFRGSAPAFGTNAFGNVTATAYYHPDATWTEAVMQNYGGSIRWVQWTCEHPGMSSVAMNAHCTKVKQYEYTCDICGETVTKTVEPIGHANEAMSVVEATCTKEGHTLYSCSRCGLIYEGDYTQPLGHTYGEGGVCIRCDDVMCDFTGDDTLDVADVEYLLWHTILGAEQYPVGAEADLDGDGEVTDKDVQLLLLMVLFPGMGLQN